LDGTYELSDVRRTRATGVARVFDEGSANEGLRRENIQRIREVKKVEGEILQNTFRRFEIPFVS